MIQGEHCVIRAADPDDAPHLKRLYDAPGPRFALLDRKHERLLPTRDELHEVLARQDRGVGSVQGSLYTVEDRTGAVAGFCALRSLVLEARYAELAVMLFEDEAYDAPGADEAVAFLFRTAFRDYRLNKLLAHCLDCEAPLRGLLLRHGFTSNGRQREAVYAVGRRHDLETLSRYHDGAAPGGDTHADSH